MLCLVVTNCDNFVVVTQRDFLCSGKTNGWFVYWYTKDGLCSGITKGLFLWDYAEGLFV